MIAQEAPIEAMIEITRHELPLGRHYLTYKWIGKPWQPVWITELFVDQQLSDFPWKLIEVDRDYSKRAGLYVRADGFWVVTRWMTSLKIGIQKLLGLTYYRLIITAMVWALAYVPQGDIPSWRHLGKKR